MKLDQGDLFEQTHAEWIRQRLPHYESIWAAFIGHNGKGQMVEMFGLSSAQEEKRKIFSQAHYSLAISAFQVEQLASRITKAVDSIRSLGQFLDEYERLFLFVAYVGHIRDMLKTIDSVLGSELHGTFQDFYAQRSHVLHSPRLPVSFDDVSWLTPKIAKQNEQAGEWHSKAAWDSVSFKDGKYTADFVSETLEQMFAMIVMVHPKIFSAADRFFEGRRVKQGVVYEPPKTLGVSLGANVSQMDFSTAAASGSFIKPSNMD